MEYREDELWIEAYNLCRLVKTTFAKVIWSNGNQIRRAASSIHANIAEGLGRNSDSEFSQFCYYALGSAYECASFAFEALDFGLITEKHQRQIDEQTERFKMFIEERLSGELTTDEPQF